MVICGVMSGSSLDGLDIAIVDFQNSDDHWNIIHTYLISYSDEWEQNLRDFHTLDARSYIRFKYDYSHYVGQLINDFLTKINLDVEYISFHGHTLVHSPEKGFTEQIGNGAIIAAKTGIPTFTEFRNYDITLGGQGTPLAPIVDVHLFGGYDYYLNLGGIANITSIDDERITAYDICPCNQVFNYFAQLLDHKYDKDGHLAREGDFDERLHHSIGLHPYFTANSPKSIDNNWVRDVFIPSLGNTSYDSILNTYMEWMTSHIADQIKILSNSRMLVTGGGTHNTYLIELLSEKLQLKNCELVIPTIEIIDYKEAILMAFLAKRYLDRKCNVLHTVTGAERSSISGSLHY